MPSEGQPRKDVYAASSWLAYLLRDLSERGVLEGEVRESVAQSLEAFRVHSAADPDVDWHVELLDEYEALHGKHPEDPRLG